MAARASRSPRRWRNCILGGTTVVDLGTGITVSTPFTIAHAAGVSIRGLGSGITFTPALAQAHDAGTTMTTTPSTLSGDGTATTASAPTAAAPTISP